MAGTSKGYNAAWEEAAKLVTSKNFHGLRIICPKCRRQGTVFSKWIKGPSIKPLFVCHYNGNGSFRVCELSDSHAATARRKVGINRQDVIKSLRMGKAIVLFSGGKDSLCLLHYISKLAKSIGKEIVALHVDTTAGFPEVERYVEEVCHHLNVPLTKVRPVHDYFDLAKRWGIPGVKSRWCCQTLKIAPIRRFISTLEGPKIVFDGIRSAESSIRATYVPLWFHPSFRTISVSPIFGWSDERIMKYISKYELPRSPASKLKGSSECWCGAYRNRSDFEDLLGVHPDIFDKLIAVENAQKGKYTFLFENGVRIPLMSLRTNKKNKA
jgi:3'-phosphoadenosine 5'-phosphosulfate sulfotransferase (PAPS reductase)/FAD synthetase